mmetsp:Transcript_47767/g.102046  ORF Transcript_47767/g.102046 Transcript_47767/m.102046 type:complete len:237 (+) Transcript_47767:148-858(+)
MRTFDSANGTRLRATRSAAARSSSAGMTAVTGEGQRARSRARIWLCSVTRSFPSHARLGVGSCRRPAPRRPTYLAQRHLAGGAVSGRQRTSGRPRHPHSRRNHSFRRRRRHRRRHHRLHHHLVLYRRLASLPYLPARLQLFWDASGRLSSCGAHASNRRSARCPTALYSRSSGCRGLAGPAWCEAAPPRTGSSLRWPPPWPRAVPAPSWLCFASWCCTAYIGAWTTTTPRGCGCAS